MAEVGKAYITVTPKLDSGNLASTMPAAGKSAGAGFGGTFSVAAGNLIANALSNLASAVGDTFSKAFSNYANYEQLVGGVDTLFKESSAIVQENAAKAFETAGMSANEYMENVTSFSASLLQGLGGDTEKAAAYADMAVRDMSDNANKMGTDMGRITDAYQGFAKQNYTMLDNLKLGYGGTKGEMERLLEDASKIAGVDFNIDNYSDVIQAIHVMQESMGIAGTTAEEARNTISGSINMTKAAWQNFLTGIFDDNAQLDELAYDLMDSVGAVLQNVGPRIALLASRVFLELPNGLMTVIDAIPSMLEPVIMSVFGEQLGGQILQATKDACWGFTDTMQQLGASLMTLFETVLETLRPVIATVVEIIAAAIPLVQQAIGIVVSFVTDNVIPLVTEVLTIVQPVVEQITGLISEHMPQIQRIVQTAMQVIQQVIQTVWPIVRAVVVAVVSAIMSFMQSAWPVISGVVDTAMNAIESAINGISYIVGVVQGIFNGVKRAIEDPIGTARDFIHGAIEAIKGFFNFSISWPHIPLPHPYISPSGWSLGDLLEGVIPSIGIDWYAKGGMVDDATLIGAGERGAELIWPSYDPYLSRYADAIADRMGNRAGVDIHDCTFNVREESDIQRVAYELNTLINRQTVGGLA